MSAQTIERRRTGRRQSDAKREQAEQLRAGIELAAQSIDDDAPDFIAFLARWGDRYAENNLRRLWVQAPNATCLHKFMTWQGMGRQVRTGQKAVYLMQPRTSVDPDKVTALNPRGEVFHGASWMALFDYAQTMAIGEFDDTVPDADPALVAEVKRLRMAACQLHPDMTGRDTAPEFMAAWARYEQAKARMTGQR